MVSEKPTVQQVDGKQARITHAALVVSLVVIAALSLWVPAGDAAPATSLTVTLKVVAYGYFAAIIPVIFYFRRRITARRSGADLQEWWRMNVAYAAIVWALTEGGALLGMVVGWGTGSRILHIGAALLGLLLLYWFRPGKLEATR